MRHLRSGLREQTFAAIYRQGVPWSAIETAYAKWQVNAKHEPCRFKDPVATSECRCAGCRERNIMVMFEVVASNAAATVVCQQLGHLYGAGLSPVCKRCGAVRGTSVIKEP